MDIDTWEARTRLGGFEANTFAESSFLSNLASFVRGAVVCTEHPPEILLAGKTKANGMTSLSPEVQARLEIVKKESSAMGSLSPKGVATASGARHNTSVVDKEGRIDWTCLANSPDAAEGDERALVEGARLAVSCHYWLRGKFQREPYFQFQMETLRGVPFLAEWILRGSDEEAYVALCICFTILEKALFDIHHEADRKRHSGDEPGWPGGSFGTEPTVVQGEDKDGGDGGNFAGGSSDDVRVDGRIIVILRDLIASPVVKAALPDEMSAVLRLLLLPLGFNIRNLVWHGFLAPHELPRELASLTLLVTANTLRGNNAESVPPIPRRLHSTITSETSPTITTYGDFAKVERLVGGGRCDDERLQNKRGDVSLPVEKCRSAGWALESFDDCLAYPSALTSAVGSLLSERYYSELCSLVRRSAFVLPGREEATMLGFRALREGRHALFLVAILPILEHGLRCLFSCANDSPEHFFAQLRQYYTTLDGFGQRARHQLLLDQEINGYPGRPNLLLAALGPGMSACLLDLFMMSAGPNLRGKIAHAEIDMSSAFLFPPYTTLCGDHCDGREDGSTTASHPGVVTLTACAFIALCYRYDPAEQHNGSQSPSISEEFRETLERCDACCSDWVSRFHPHELLEADLQACRTEFDNLASEFVRRAVSVERLPGTGDLARMSVAVSRTADTHAIQRSSAQKERLTTEHHGQDAESSSVRASGFRNDTTREGEITFGGDSELPLLLTVIDSAHRLIPREVDVEDSGSSKTVKEGRVITKKGANAPTGVFTPLQRVDAAIREYSAVMTCRFRHIEAAYTGRLTTTKCPQPQTPLAESLVAQPRMNYQPTIRGTPTFGVYMQSTRCSTTPAHGFECLGQELSALEKNSSTSLHQGGNKTTSLETSHRSSAQNLCLGSRRISPITNVITALPIPQIVCMRRLCRLCADTITRGLRERLSELEALLASGAAPSAKRRAYANTLLVAPTLLRFLAITAAAVEAFVLEWDLLHQEDLRCKSVQTSCQGSTPPPAARPEEGLLNALASPSKEETACEEIVPSVKIKQSESKIVETRLAFLRRLAAVNGALSLCVNQGSCGRPLSFSGSSLTNRGKSDVEAGKRKGYTQALEELALFLETNTARRGFTGS